MTLRNGLPGVGAVCLLKSERAGWDFREFKAHMANSRLDFLNVSVREVEDNGND